MKHSWLKKCSAISMAFLLTAVMMPVMPASAEEEATTQTQSVEASDQEETQTQETETSTAQESSDSSASSQSSTSTEGDADTDTSSSQTSSSSQSSSSGSGTSSAKVSTSSTSASQEESSSTSTTSEAVASTVDNSTDLEDGTYEAEDFSYSGGTGKVTFSCEKIVVKDGKAQAQIKVSSTSYSHFFLGTLGTDADGNNTVGPTNLDTTKTYSGENGIYSISSQTATVPVELNQEMPIGGRTTAMSKVHWVQYYMTITLSNDATPVSDSTDTDDADSSDDEDTTDTDSTPTTTKKLKNGTTYKVRSDTDRRMFYMIPKGSAKTYSILKISKKGKMTATITLSGTGYDYLYMGTTKAAAKASKSSLSHYKVRNGYYTYKIPVSKLDKWLVISAHSKRLNKWYQHKIIFYSAGAKKTSSTAVTTGSGGTSVTHYLTHGTQTTFKKSNKADKVSKSSDDSGKSTSSVNNSTKLKDGVYTPKSFSWSGGSGRLAYIRCDKVTVTGGKAYATIVFGSPYYDLLKANGRIYSKSGGGNSKFVIPVQLNANNTIIARTTAMSQPHWISYTIYISLSGSGAQSQASKSKLSNKAPKVSGLKLKSTTKTKHAKYFKIYNYEKGIKILSVDVTKNTALYKKVTKAEEKKQQEEANSSETDVEYDENGKKIVKSQHEITEDLYKNNVVNYVLVPEDQEIPAGMDKNYIVIRIPSTKSYVSSENVFDMLEKLDRQSKISSIGIKKSKVRNDKIKDELKVKNIKFAGTYLDPDYTKIIKSKVDLCILPSSMLPDKIKKSKNSSVSGKTVKEQNAEANKKKKQLYSIERQFTALDIPVLIDRSSDEKGKLAKAEWIKVYGAIYGCSKKANKIYSNYEKKVASK
ncbi:MAG: hypothetical protein ACOYJJ_01285 [Anaerovoracaceae bacterium]